MRVTRVLLYREGCPGGGHSLKWYLNRIWKYKGFVVDTKTMMPDVLKAKGVEVVDAAEYYFSKKKYPDWERPFPKDERWYVPTEKDDPDYKETPIYEFNTKSKLLEGHKQVLQLIKTQPLEGLPDAVRRYIGAVQIPNRDRLVQRAIIQSNRWDPSMDKLPRRHNPDLPRWQFKAEWGIPHSKRCEVLASFLLRIIRQSGGRFPDVSQRLRVAPRPHVSTYYYYNGYTHLGIKGLSGEYITHTDRALPPFAPPDSTTLTESESYQLPDIYPISPLIDLKKQHVWRHEDVAAFHEGFSHERPHTLYMSHQTDWSVSQRQAQALMFTFAHSLAYAKSVYGPEPRVLPEPIVMNCIHTDNANFDFLCFQLNTTDFTTPSGVKNLAWLDAGNALYRRLEPRRSMLRNTEYHDYDPDVFEKLLALHVYGLDLSYTWRDLEHDVEHKREAVST